MTTKRLLDIILSAVALVMLMPLLALVSLVILVTQGRPVLYGHVRRGQGGKPFKCLKFRSMVKNGDEVLSSYLERSPGALAEWTATRKLRNDPRVTAFGNVLRKSSIDELPQFLNVLRGEMSLVGPRPIVQEEVDHYGDYIRQLEEVKPGLTGPWQISGRSDLSYETRVQLDCEYIRAQSVVGDIVILFRTIPAVLQSRGSY